MIDTAVSRLAERNIKVSQVLDRTRAATHISYPPSPCCDAGLSGTSSVLWCGDCGTTYQASQFDREVPNGGERR